MKTVLLAALLFVQRGVVPPTQDGTITGRVLTADGSPAAMVRVAALDVPADGTAGAEAPALIALTQTGADGNYRLTDVPPGRYFIMAGVVETPTYYPGTRALSSAKPLDIAAGKTVSGIDFRIEPVSTGLTVSGPSGATVRLSLTRSNRLR